MADSNNIGRAYWNSKVRLIYEIIGVANPHQYWIEDVDGFSRHKVGAAIMEEYLKGYPLCVHCPECDRWFIPNDDYLCSDCRHKIAS